MTEEPCVWARGRQLERGGFLPFACGVMPERVIGAFGLDPGRAPQWCARIWSTRRGPVQFTPGALRPGGAVSARRTVPGPHPVLEDRRVGLKAAGFAAVLRTAGVKLRVGRRWGHPTQFSTRLAVDANG